MSGIPGCDDEAARVGLFQVASCKPLTMLFSRPACRQAGGSVGEKTSEVVCNLRCLPFRAVGSDQVPQHNAQVLVAAGETPCWVLEVQRGEHDEQRTGGT
jgi:hypothetical protein